MPSNYQKKQVQRTEEGFYICERCGGYFEESEMTKGRYGVTCLCKNCTSEAHKKGAENRKRVQDNLKQEVESLRIELADLKRQMRETADVALKRATGRELLLELKSRGYEGKFVVVTRKEIDLSKLE